MAASKTWAESALSDWNSKFSEFGLGMTGGWMKDWMTTWKFEEHVLEPGFVGVFTRVIAMAPKDARRAGFIALATAIEHWDGPKGLSTPVTLAIAAAKVLVAGGLHSAPDVVENLIEDGKLHPDELEVGLADYVKGIFKWLHLAFTDPKAVLAASGEDMSDEKTDTGAAPAKDAGKKVEPKGATKPAPSKPDPLTGVASFEDATKAQWVLKLYAALRSSNPTLATLLGRSMAEQPKDLEKLIGTMPEIGDGHETVPEVATLLSALGMREEYNHKEPEPSKLDRLTDFVEKIPVHLRPFESWASSWFDNEGTSGDVRAKAREYSKWLMTWGTRLLMLAITGLVIIIGLAVVSMLMSIYGIFWAHPVWILVGMVGIIVLRFITPIYDIPLNMAAALVDFLDPTDGTGMIGGTVGRFLDMVAPDRKKTPAADREPITWFTDKAVSVSLAWALVTALGCLVALVIDPTTARPSETLMLSGSAWLYFMLDTVRKGWRPVMKNDEDRYIPASLRKKFYRGSIFASTAIGIVKFVVGFVLAVGMGVGGSGKMVQATQQAGEQAVVAKAAKSGVDIDPQAGEQAVVAKAAKSGVDIDPPLTADQCQRGLTKISDPVKFCKAYPAEKICACP